ncbi:MAG: energy-coupling factor transporter transmembrane component T family protein [Anaerolineae bacterium]
MQLNLDPRTKLILALAYAAILILTRALPALLAELALLAVLIALLGLGRVWLRALRLVLAMTAIVFAISLLAFDLTVALTTSVRLVALVTTFFVFFQATLPEDLGNGLVKMGVPYAFTFILTGAMQFVPVMARKIQDIVDAQRARGIPLGWDLAGWRHIPALLTPLLIQSLKLSDELAEAMESRGFGRSGRTFMREYRVKSWEYGLMALAVGLVIGVWYVRR